jgi:hypothetical protein
MRFSKSPTSFELCWVQIAKKIKGILSRSTFFYGLFFFGKAVLGPN